MLVEVVEELHHSIRQVRRWKAVEDMHHKEDKHQQQQVVVHYCCLAVVDMHHKVDWRTRVVDNKGRSYEVPEAAVAVVVVVVGKS